MGVSALNLGGFCRRIETQAQALACWVPIDLFSSGFRAQEYWAGALPDKLVHRQAKQSRPLQNQRHNKCW